MVKNLPVMRDTQVQNPGEGNGNPLQYSGLKNPMDRGQKSLTGYSPQVHKESDTTEQHSLIHIGCCQNNIK